MKLTWPWSRPLKRGIFGDLEESQDHDEKKEEKKHDKGSACENVIPLIAD